MLHTVLVADTSLHQLIRGDCVNRAFMVKQLLKNTAKEKQQAEEICLGQETQGMDIRPVEICALVWWVQIWDLWFHPSCLCSKQKRWTDGLNMHGSHRGAWRRTCDGVGVLCSWHCWAFIQNWRHTEPTWLPQHPQHAIPPRLNLVGPSFTFQQDNDPKHTSRLCKGYLTKKENNGVLRQMTFPPQSPDLNPIEMVWDGMDRRVKAKGPTSAQHLWKLLQD